MGDSLSPEDATYVLRRFNQWLDSLALEPGTMYFVLRTLKVLGANVASYTIGTGGSINIVRPTAIENAALIIDTSASPVTEVPIDVFSDQRWQSIQQKGLTNPLAQGVYYDHGWSAGLGLIYPWPVPTVGTTELVLYSKQAATQFANLDTDYTFPPGYEEYFRTNLPAKIAGGFGKKLTSDQIQAARESRAKIKIANLRPVESVLDARVPGARAGGTFDWRTGDFR